MLQCVAVCCGVPQCVAVCCSVLQWVAVCCSVMQCVAVWCRESHLAVCCSVLQCVAMCCSVLQCVAVSDDAAVSDTATHCNTLQHTATHCNTLQHAATLDHIESHLLGNGYYTKSPWTFSIVHKLTYVWEIWPTFLCCHESPAKGRSNSKFLNCQLSTKKITGKLTFEKFVLRGTWSLGFKFCDVLESKHTLQHTATHCNTLQHTAPHWTTLQHTATHCNTLQHTATHCNTHSFDMQHTAAHCSTQQRTATHTNTHPLYKRNHIGLHISTADSELVNWFHTHTNTHEHPRTRTLSTNATTSVHTFVNALCHTCQLFHSQNNVSFIKLFCKRDL